MKVRKICQWCGKPFVAQKTTTCFCSHRCSSLGYKERIRERKRELKKMQEILTPKSAAEGQDFLSFAQVATLMGVTRQYIYKLVKENKLRASRISGKKSFIRRAEQVALRRGWITAAQVRNNNIHQVNNDCMEIIRSMSSWSWMDYKAALIRKGYSVLERRDSKNILRGYILQKGNAKYKASELGVGRNLMASKLYQTWLKEHPESNQSQRMRESKSVTRPSVGYTQYEHGTVPYRLTTNGDEHRFYIPEKVLTMFDDEFDYRFISNAQELTDMAVSIFVGLLAAQDVNVGSGGGGSQSDLPWRDKDDDDLKWARKCALAASRSLGKKPKTGFRR